jgi:hypothetical protein
MMQHSCPGLSLVTRAGFTVRTLRQSNNPSNGKVQTHKDRIARQLKRNVKTVLIIFFGIKGTRPGRPNSQFHTLLLMFYGDCMKTCKRFTLNFGDKKLAVVSQQRIVPHFLFHQGVLVKTT